MIEEAHPARSGAKWIAPVVRWSVWDTSPERDGQPSSGDLGFLDPMLRRRLSLLTKIALKVGHDCAHSLRSTRMVYASRHGELARTTEMLGDLASGEALSPTAFSMSVPNTAAGVFSIFRHDNSPTTTISSAAESFGYGLLEACLQLAEEPRSPVLFIYADEPVPGVYGIVEPDDGETHAIGLLLDTDAGKTLSCSYALADQSASRESQSRAFLRCLDGISGNQWHGSGKSWAWSWQT